MKIKRAEMINELNEVLEGTDYFVVSVDPDYPLIDRLPGETLGQDKLTLLVNSIALKVRFNNSPIIVYRFDREDENNITVKVFNTHSLRPKDTYALVREFKYTTASDLLDDIKSAERSLLNLPV